MKVTQIYDSRLTLWNRDVDKTETCEVFIWDFTSGTKWITEEWAHCVHSFLSTQCSFKEKQQTDYFCFCFIIAQKLNTEFTLYLLTHLCSTTEVITCILVQFSVKIVLHKTLLTFLMILEKQVKLEILSTFFWILMTSMFCKREK